MATLHSSYHKSSRSQRIPSLSISLHRKVLSNPGDLLKKAGSPKMLCSDLWTRRMQREVVEVMLARGQLGEKPRQRMNITASDSSFLTKTVRLPTRSHDSSHPPLDHQLSLCQRLQRDLHRIKAKMTYTRSTHHSGHPKSEIEVGLNSFIRGEVQAFHTRRYCFYKPSKAAQTKRLQEAGLSFFSFQRRHLSNNDF